MIKSIPTTLPGELRYPQVEEQKQSIVYKIASVADLSPGVNEGAILTAKVVQLLEKPADVPISFAAVDSKGVYFVCSFYHAAKSLKDKLVFGDLLFIKNP